MTADASKRLMWLLAALMGAAGYVQTVNGVAAPFMAREFGLDDAGIARVFGWIACNAFFVVLLARQTDRLGRRRLLLLCAAGLPFAALGSAIVREPSSWLVTQVLAQAFANTLVMVSTVVVAEELPLERRASGQGLVGIAAALGSGGAMAVTSAFASGETGWRGAWLLVVASVLLLPFLRRALPETTRWRDASDRGETAQARARELLSPPYGRRVLGLLLFVLCGGFSGTAVGMWPYYHLVTNLGRSPGVATVILFLGGALGLAGYRYGGVSSDRLGRRATLAGGALLSTSLMALFYLTPPALASSILLGALFGLATVMGNASIVAVRSSSTELFPTRLRSTVNGWAAATGAFAAVVANFATAMLAGQLGGLVPAIAWLALMIIPACIAFVWLLPETAGLELEAAALERIREEVDAFIALGSNLGDRARQLEFALASLRAAPGVRVEAVSSWYETDPVGPAPQGRYLNGAVHLRTTLSAHALLERLLAIEREAGRERSGERDAARTLDLDLLLHGDACCDDPELSLPHPRLHERAFVLTPLAEIAAAIRHPVLGVTIAVLESERRDPAAVRPFASTAG